MSLYVIPEPPLPQTVRVVRELTGRVLVWQPPRWVPDVPVDTVTDRLRASVRNPRADHEEVDEP